MRFLFIFNKIKFLIKDWKIDVGIFYVFNKKKDRELALLLLLLLFFYYLVENYFFERLSFKDQVIKWLALRF